MAYGSPALDDDDSADEGDEDQDGEDDEGRALRALIASRILRRRRLRRMLIAHLLGGKVDPPLKDVLEQIDLWWVHYQYGFQKGILNLKDVVYYVATTYFFLLLAIKTLEAKRWQ